MSQKNDRNARQIVQIERLTAELASCRATCKRKARQVDVLEKERAGLSSRIDHLETSIAHKNAELVEEAYLSDCLRQKVLDLEERLAGALNNPKPKRFCLLRLLGRG